MSKNRFYGLMPSVAFCFECRFSRRNIGEYPRKDFIVIRIKREFECHYSNIY